MVYIFSSSGLRTVLIFCCLILGCPVFALWKNFYYPGEIEKLTRPNHYNVVFHDDEQKVLNRKFIYPISTFQIGQSLSAKRDEEEDYHEGEVVAVTPYVYTSVLKVFSVVAAKPRLIRNFILERFTILYFFQNNRRAR